VTKIRLGIVGTAEIAFRRFLPALIKNDNFEYIGVASRVIEKTKKFTDIYGGIGYKGYEEIINDNSIDALYIPLPPSLHYEWSYKALNSGKHVLLEKPFTTNIDDTRNLIEIAKKKNLALHENYMFEYHSQLNYAKKIVNEKILGNLRLIRIIFSFPKRNEDDFRYKKELGGGALLDCGGYTVKLANILLGDSAKLVYSYLNKVENSDVDIFGNVTIANGEGLNAQLSFGMDNTYRCELELLGSKGSAIFSRIFTAPIDFNPSVVINILGKEENIVLDNDDQFYNSIEEFRNCIYDEKRRIKNYDDIIRQGNMIHEIANRR